MTEDPKIPIRSTCPYCGVGCGITVEADSAAKTKILGDQDHPANFGRLCSKGSALAETLVDDGRLLEPSIDGKSVTWTHAVADIANRISDSIEQHGVESVAFYLSGQLLTEDYYVANKLMKGYIGTANVDTNSRLCMSSAVAGYKRAFGSDTVPCSYEDLEQADLLVLVGSNAAWTHPILYQRMHAAKLANPNLRVVLVDPKETATAELADLHLNLAASSDNFLFQGLLNYLIVNGKIDQDYIDRYTNNFSQVKDSVADVNLDHVADKTGVSSEKLARFYTWFADTKKVITFYSQGVNQSATGSDKCNTIINCHLATAKLGYSGAGPFSITGQPNAMGGREVGGLSNQLAAHMDFAEVDKNRVQRFWNSPVIAQKEGLKAVELFDSVASGKVKLIWIIGTNPAVSLPATSKVREALAKCDNVIVSDITHTDTTAAANVLLPVLGWGEKDGTVTNSERCISRQRAFTPAPGSAKADWWVISQVAARLGYKEAFDYQNPHQIFSEHAKLSGFENSGSRDFDISGLANLSEREYDRLTPIHWPVTEASQITSGTKPNIRMFSDGRFYTPNKKANFVVNARTLFDSASQLNSSSRPNSSSRRYCLNTGRVRDQWHTMSRSGLAPSLSGHNDIPFVQIHPHDARDLVLQDKQFVRLSNEYGEFLASVKISLAVKPGEVFSPIHWSNQYAYKSTVGDVVSPEVDPVSGQPELKASLVSIQPFECQHWARVASKVPLDKQGFSYWAQAKCERGYISLIGLNEETNWRDLMPKNAQPIEYEVATSNRLSSVLADNDDGIEMLIYADDRVDRLPSYSWVSSAYDQNKLSQLASLMRAESGASDQLVCSCFKVGQKAVFAEIERGTKSVEELGARLGCGSKCGSCKPELYAYLRA